MVTKCDYSGRYPEPARLLDSLADDNLVSWMNSIKESEGDSGALNETWVGFGENFQVRSPWIAEPATINVAGRKVFYPNGWGDAR
jgi:hypothetical protein